MFDMLSASELTTSLHMCSSRLIFVNAHVQSIFSSLMQPLTDDLSECVLNEEVPYITTCLRNSRIRTMRNMRICSKRCGCILETKLMARGLPHSMVAR